MGKGVDEGLTLRLPVLGSLLGDYACRPNRRRTADTDWVEKGGEAEGARRSRSWEETNTIKEKKGRYTILWKSVMATTPPMTPLSYPRSSPVIAPVTTTMKVKKLNFPA